MDFQIVPIAEEHIAGFHAAVDGVARERRYLAMLEAPPLEESADWVRGNLRAKALYDKVGFAVEGRKRKAALFDGRHYDLILMALVF